MLSKSEDLAIRELLKRTASKTLQNNWPDSLTPPDKAELREIRQYAAKRLVARKKFQSADTLLQIFAKVDI